MDEKTIEKRRDEAIRRALSTPPTPTKAIKGKTREKPKNLLVNAQSVPKEPEKP